MGTLNPKRHRAWGRVGFVHPGKHGVNDLRVEFGASAPTLAETLALVWGHFRAEDRYGAEHHRGRAMYKELIDDIYAAATWADALKVVERCATLVGGEPVLVREDDSE